MRNEARSAIVGKAPISIAFRGCLPGPEAALHRVDNGFTRQAGYYMEFRGKSNRFVPDTVGGQIGGGFGGNSYAAHRFDGHWDGRSATLELGSSLTFDP